MSTVGRQIYSRHNYEAREECVCLLTTGALLHCSTTSLPQCKELDVISLFQTLLTYVLGELYKIFIPFLCKTGTKSHLNSGVDVLWLTNAFAILFCS